MASERHMSALWVTLLVAGIFAWLGNREWIAPHATPFGVAIVALYLAVLNRRSDA